MERVRGQSASYYQEMILAKQLATVDALKNKFLGIQEKEHTLCLLMDHHNTYMANLLSYGTLKNYFTTIKYIKEFILEEYRKSDIYLTELGYKTSASSSISCASPSPSTRKKIPGWITMGS